MRGLMQPGFRGFDNRRSYWAYLFARLKPGVSIEQATTAINLPYAAIVNDVEAPLQTGMSEQTMARFKTKTITLADGRRGQSDMHEEATTPLILLLSVTGVVLLIACANIANLLLVRGAGRAGEMAVRLSIGASRRQLVGQLLLESVVLASLGAALGILVSRWTLAFIASLLPAEAAATIAYELDSPRHSVLRRPWPSRRACCLVCSRHSTARGRAWSRRSRRMRARRARREARSGSARRLRRRRSRCRWRCWWPRACSCAAW